MAKPKTREELITYAKTALGYPILEINVAEEQIDNIVDDTIQYFQERHYDGVIRTYLKYEFTEDDIKRGSKYNPFFQAGISTAGQTYPGATGVNVDQYVENSNYIQIPDHIIGIEKVFTPPQATGGNIPYFPGAGVLGAGASPVGMMGYGYLGYMSMFGGYDMTSMYIAQMWRSTFEFLADPPSIIRFNKRQDRLYLDINWQSLSKGQVIVIDCYRALDPEQFCKIYNDSWVKRYLISALKRQWGQNLIKFTGTKLPGGLEMNGRQLYDDGVREIEEIRREMSSSYELPPLDYVG